MQLFGKTLNYVIKALITLITTLDTVYQRPWHLMGAGPSSSDVATFGPAGARGCLRAPSQMAGSHEFMDFRMI